MVGARLRARACTAALPAARALGVSRAPAVPSELHTPPLGSRKSGLRPSRDHPGLQLGNGPHLLQQEFARCAFNHRKIGKPHINAGLERAGQEGDRAGKPVKLATTSGT
jgi:hypothetical protein